MAQKKVVKEENNKILSVVDVGYGFTKILSNVKKELMVFPSAVSMGGASFGNGLGAFGLNEDGSLNLDLLIAEVDGVTSFVGNRAMQVMSEANKRTTAVNRTKDAASRLLFQTAIAATLPDESGTYDNIHVVTGLPNKDYNDQTVEELIEFIKTPFTIKFHIGRNDYIEKHVEVSSVSVYAQPYGTYAYAQHGFGNVEKGEQLITRKPGYKDILGIIDIGHVTTDYCLFNNGNVDDSGKTLGSTSGTRLAYTELDEILTNMLREQGHTHFKIKESELDVAVQNKTLKVGQLRYDVTDEVEEAVQIASGTIASTISDKWGSQITHLEGVVLTGGGAELFTEQLINALATAGTEEGFAKVEGSQFANLIGYYIMGVLELSEEIGDLPVYLDYVKPVFGGEA